MGVDPLGDPGADGNAAHHLADALPGVDPRKTALGLLPAHEQRPRPPPADVQGQEAGELGPDRHLAPLAALTILDGDHALGEADIPDPQGNELGYPRPGLEQSLHHQPDLTTLGIGLVEEAQLLLEAQPRRGATPLLRRLEPSLLPRGFEHRLGLRVIQPLAGEDGGNRVGDPIDVARHEIAQMVSRSKPACRIGRARPKLKVPGGCPGHRAFRTAPSGKPNLGGRSCASRSSSASSPTTVG